MIKPLNSEIHDSHTVITIKAAVDAILQAPPMDEVIYGYVIAVLDQTLPSTINQGETIPFSKQTASLLDMAAIQLMYLEKGRYSYRMSAFPREGVFSTLSRSERLRAINLLERLEVPLESLPEPFTNNPGLTQSMKNTITQLTFLGYYSEWTGYGSTRFNRPEYKRIEYFPMGWIQTKYPGPAFGYRKLRGLLLGVPNKGGNHHV
ncbi:hypothetical protein M3175_20145 [Robertmurraya korlensis]|uniref:hypothetical protein n=1 Tax=Robertmurraya korlensis TaxID=519977 RepID=UPI00203DE3DB|nr:hypothetical protein [Robertmurraya korlensis]MCM3603055.1 hypothetical protein [Robertmurraya korlensis]